jgi:hypothetical protein
MAEGTSVGRGKMRLRVYRPCRYNSNTALDLIVYSVLHLTKLKLNHAVVTPSNDSITQCI